MRDGEQEEKGEDTIGRMQVLEKREQEVEKGEDDR